MAKPTETQIRELGDFREVVDARELLQNLQLREQELDREIRALQTAPRGPDSDADAERLLRGESPATVATAPATDELPAKIHARNSAHKAIAIQRRRVAEAEKRASYEICRNVRDEYVRRFVKPIRDWVRAGAELCDGEFQFRRDLLDGGVTINTSILRPITIPESFTLDRRRNRQSRAKMMLDEIDEHYPELKGK